MASTNFTTHYSIPLPLGTDLTTPMDYNEAAEEIDTALFGAVTDAGNASEAAGEAVNTANTASAAVDAIGADLALEKAKIVQLQTRMTAAENDIDDVYTDVTDMITAYKEPSATSTHAYAIGDYFIYNETLYKATAAITVGATIVPNTNCETTNVSSELKQINSDLAGKEPKLYTDYVQIMSDGVKTQGQLLTELSALVDFSKTNALYTRLVIGGDCFVMNNRGEALNFAAFFSISSDNLIFTRSIGTTEPYIRAYNYSMSTGTLADVSSTVPPAGLFFTLYY